MKVLVKLTFTEYMSLGPQEEHRLIENTEEAKEAVREYIEHMNNTWTGGYYEKTFKILNREESINFINSDKIDPSCIDMVKEELGL